MLEALKEIFSNKELIIQCLVITTVIYIFLMKFINKPKELTEEEKKKLERLEELIPDEQLITDLEKAKDLSFKESINYGMKLANKYGVSSEDLAKRLKELEKKQKEKAKKREL